MSKLKTLPRSSVNRALNALGDRWSMLIIQQAFLGSTRFEEFRSRCEIPRSTLSNRLKALIANGIFELRPHRAGTERQSYHLTGRGWALFDSVLSSWAWGMRWGMTSEGMPTALIHEECGKPMIPKLVCDHCGGEVTLRSCFHKPGPGTGFEQVSVQRMHRRRYPVNQGYPSEVVDLVGDRWTGMVIATQYFGIHRFDHMQSYLNMATNILADRLKALEANGILERRLYELMPPRYEYWLTKKGMDLYPHALTLMLWADEWLADPKGPPVLVYHKPCGHLLGASVVCGECEEPLLPNNVRPRLPAKPRKEAVAAKA